MEIKPKTQIWMAYTCIGPHNRYPCPLAFFESSEAANAWRDRMRQVNPDVAYHVMPQVLYGEADGPAAEENTNPLTRRRQGGREADQRE